MREATHDEEWYTEEQRQILLLTSKGDSSGHDHTTTDGKDKTFERTHQQTAFEDFLSCLLQWHRTAASHQADQQATDYIAKENKEKLAYLAFLDETSSASVEAKTIMHNGEKAEGEEDSADDTFLSKVAKAGDTNADAGEDR